MISIAKAIQNGQVNATIGVVISDKPEAPGLEAARALGLTAIAISPRDFSSKTDYEQQLIATFDQHAASLIILAGYMRLVGPTLLDQYPAQILNIHPSLLPAFKGLDAQRQAFDYGVRISGCSVHFVTNELDGGPIVLQEAVPVMSDDSVQTLSHRILDAEHRLLPQAIQLFAEGKLGIKNQKAPII